MPYTATLSVCLLLAASHVNPTVSRKEVNMQARTLKGVLMAGAVVFAMVMPSSVFGEGAEVTAKAYENCIVKEIVKCRNQSALIDSKSPNLKAYARLKIQKAAFLADRKESLVKELLDYQIDPSDHSIRVYLNSRFYDEMK
jgi:hypothetical protein